MQLDRIQASREMLQILQHTLSTEEIIKIKERILENSDPYEINILAHYVASLILEREENDTLRARPCIVEYIDDVDYKVVKVCDTREEAEEILDNYDEYDCRGKDILFLFRP